MAKSLYPVEDTDLRSATVKIALLVLSSALLLFLTQFSENEHAGRFLAGASAGATAAAIALVMRGSYDLARGKLATRAALPVLRAELQPAMLATANGRIIAANEAALNLPDFAVRNSLRESFAPYVASPEILVRKLSEDVAEQGSAVERIGYAGGSACLVVRKLAPDRNLWVLDSRGAQHDAFQKHDFPVLTLSMDDTILGMNEAACRVFDPAVMRLGDVVLDLPLQQGVRHRIRLVSGEVDALTLCVSQHGGQRALCILLDGAPPVEAPILAGPGLLDALPVPMLKIEADGTLIEANAEARTILSLDGPCLPALFELVEGMGRPIAGWLSEAAEGRGLLKPEIVRAVLPGEELFLQIALGRTFEDGRVVLVGILNDATELKTLEAQFVQSQKMQAIGQLAGGVAHDFNNLLTAISGHCDLLLLRHDQGDPDYADLIQISQNANRAASLVGQLLAFSRKQNMKTQALDLRDTMSDLAHLLNRLIGERIQLEVVHAPGTQIIRADRRQLEQVIVNLVVNARDAMPGGGTITISIRAEILREEFVRDRARLPAGEYVVIEVHDTGTGISADSLSKIFEPFYTTKKTGEGTGLGLSTAYGIVKQTGGFIFADSTPGTGTIFRLYFPACEQKVEPVPEVPAVRPISSPIEKGDGVILLVEDEAPVRAFASRALRMRGYTVVEADCAEAALATLEDTNLSVDVFVTDVIMPGMDGPTWVRQALKKRPDTRVVFTSGYAEEGRVEKQARIPNSVFLPKPFSLQQLTSLVQEQLS